MGKTLLETNWADCRSETFSHTWIFLPFPIFKLLPDFMFQCYRLQTWEFYFLALSISATHNGWIRSRDQVLQRAYSTEDELSLLGFQFATGHRETFVLIRLRNASVPRLQWPCRSIPVWRLAVTLGSAASLVNSEFRNGPQRLSVYQVAVPSRDALYIIG